LAAHSLEVTEQQCMMAVIVGGFEAFVSRLNLRGHPDEPEWRSHVNASVHAYITRHYAIIAFLLRRLPRPG
jgi:Uncharacterized protein family, UPF0114